MENVHRISQDLGSCTTEPIQTPGSIQPHGALLVIDLASGKVIQASLNACEFLGVPFAPVGRTVEELLGPAQGRLFIERLNAAMPNDSHRLVMNGRILQVSVHTLDGVGMLEIESATPMALAEELEITLVQVATAIDEHHLLTTTCRTLKKLTGFDRVVIYRFDEDHHGEVLAEAREEEMEPFLGLHFPESDIPRQARTLYLRNWIRCIPDATYVPVPVLPTLRPDTGQPLDLSGASLRSVSPFHLEYLANMGVLASMSVSLIVDGKLWGLISCGHRTRKELPHRLRVACETIGRVVSLQLGALIATEFRRHQLHASGGLEELAQAMNQSSTHLLQGLLGEPAFLLEATGASGAAVVLGDQVFSLGNCPSAAQTQAIAAWGRTASQRGLFVTRQLSRDAPGLGQPASCASGVLGISMPTEDAAMVIWFRGEIVQTVNWGGDPNKTGAHKAPDGVMRIHPRKSFELWAEEVRGRSRTWDAAALHFAGEIRRSAIELDLVRQVAVQKAAVKARDELVAVVSHDLRTPVSVVALQATLLQRILVLDGTEGSKRLLASAQTIQRATDRMTSLLRDLLDLAKIEAGRFDIRASPQLASQLVQDARELIQHVALGKRLSIEADDTSDIGVLGDSERVFQVFANLLGNAIKFTPEGGRITMGGSRVGGLFEFYVRDTGVGMTPEQLEHVFDRYWQGKEDTGHPGAGLGLYICRGIVHAHGGTLRAVSRPGDGSTFYFTIPLAPEIHPLLVPAFL